jgi:hypothetical protein
VRRLTIDLTGDDGPHSTRETLTLKMAGHTATGGRSAASPGAREGQNEFPRAAFACRRFQPDRSGEPVRCERWIPRSCKVLLACIASDSVRFFIAVTLNCSPAYVADCCHSVAGGTRLHQLTHHPGGDRNSWLRIGASAFNLLRRRCFHR